MAVTRTTTVANPGGVKVAVGAGQFLHFILDCGGPKPIFSFESNVKGVLFQAEDFTGHPMARYEWFHLKNPSDIQQMELLEVFLTFLTNGDYTYMLELRDAGGLVATVLQINYKGEPTDFAAESLRTVIVW